MDVVEARELLRIRRYREPARLGHEDDRFVFDREPLMPGISTGSGRSIMEERASRRRRSSAPIWFWVALGLGLLGVLGLLIVLLRS